MSPRLRKVALTAHVISSVGWLGAVACSLALGVATVSSDDAQTVRAAHLALEVVGWSVLVPLALASLVTGVLQSLGTKWGLLRHYWVAVKLLITILATAVLLLYTQTLGRMADLARETSDLERLQDPSPLLHSGIALLLLLGATVLAVFKPAGLTKYGYRRRQAAAGGAFPTRRQRREMI
ncbi:MAG: DUF2269 domain-containing protein [Solirubrobacterales bacterium]|nr:DUF2269 domain-containing protein [Solirubrobacterales bacterium]